MVNIKRVHLRHRQKAFDGVFETPLEESSGKDFNNEDFTRYMWDTVSVYLGHLILVGNSLALRDIFAKGLLEMPT